MSHRVLVFGAAGYPGSHLIPHLLDSGHQVRAAGGSQEVMAARDWPDVELVSADASDPASLGQALGGMDAAYYLAGAPGAATDAQARVFQQVALAAGLRHLVSLTPTSVTQGPDHGVPRTELILGGPILGPGSLLLDVVRNLAGREDARARIPAHLCAGMRPIALGDLIRVLARAIDHPATRGQAYYVIGPEATSLPTLVQTFADLHGWCSKPRSALSLSHKLYAHWLSMAAGIPLQAARGLVQVCGNIPCADARPLVDLTGHRLVGCSDALEDALERERSCSLPARWTDETVPFDGYGLDRSAFSRRMEEAEETDAPIAKLWAQIASIGGERGWYYHTWLWRLRGLMDAGLGGVGMRRGRRDALDVRVGDALDYYRVIAVEPGRRLTLAVEMKMPGRAVLELELLPLTGGRTRVTTRGYFQPAGALGALYWNALIPIHELVFKGLTRAIIDRA
jgi:uncharacterized protein YbjT (DUF2867 family)